MLITLVPRSDLNIPHSLFDYLEYSQSDDERSCSHLFYQLNVYCSTSKHYSPIAVCIAFSSPSGYLVSQFYHVHVNKHKWEIGSTDLRVSRPFFVISISLVVVNTRRRERSRRTQVAFLPWIITLLSGMRLLWYTVRLPWCSIISWKWHISKGAMWCFHRIRIGCPSPIVMSAALILPPIRSTWSTSKYGESFMMEIFWWIYLVTDYPSWS